MIDPVIFTIRLGGFELPIRWYGVIIMLAVLVGAWIVERGVKQRGENPDIVWDAMLWVIPAGIIGARVWYVVNDILGGNPRYIENPGSIVRINEGGLHIYGAVLFGMIALFVYARIKKVDLWLMLDSVAPALLIGQALARPANFINQELYGPPTDLPWGLAIAPENRIPPYHNLAEYPETTRFHPTFGYEIVWNLIGAAILLYVFHRFKEKVKPGIIFAGWLMVEGSGRFLIEFFRPDQPRIPGTDVSFTKVVAGLMFIFGLIWILARYQVIRIPFLSNLGEEQYQLSENTSETSQ